jgi:coenzyme F420-0:L-glutamate ligase/coenzyme F420-1:gamma-L-glutamate ligase
VSSRLTAVALPALPEVRAGDDLGRLVAESWWSLIAEDASLAPAAGDVIVVTQKVVSKAEGRIVDLATVEPRTQAVEWARTWDKDPRQVEVVLRESAEIVRMEHGVIISRTTHGFVCANAGVDASNVGTGDVVTLLPEDPDRSAMGLRAAVLEEMGVDVGVVVSDSFGRPWRLGITDVALGVSGFSPLADLRGDVDTEGRPMSATIVAVADQLASVAELTSGKTSRQPVVLIRGVTLPPGDGTVTGDVLMPAELDLFR